MSKVSTGVIDRDMGWSAFFDRARQIEEARVKVGVLSDSEAGGMHEVDEQGKAKPLTVAEVAVINEFGTEDGGQPARPFVAPTFDREREKLTAASQKLIWMVLSGEVSIEQAMGVLGSSLASEIQATIRSNVPPPNAPSTALAKAMKGKTGRFFRRDPKNVGEALAQVGAIASVKTLIDSSRMLNAVSYSVSIGKETEE